MLNFEPDPVPLLILTCRCGLSDFVKSVKSCLPMFLDELMSGFNCLVVCDTRGFFCCAGTVS